MARHRNSRSKNFGLGNNAEYATKVALRAHFGEGHYQTVKTHIERSRLFYDWLHEEHQVRDIRELTNSLFSEYALYLKTLLDEEEISVATATNRISSINVVLQIMREDQKVRIDNISDVLGEKRCYIRRSIPDGMDSLQVQELHKKLISTGFTRSAAIVVLARSTGMRLRECILADLPRLTRESVTGRINIQDGCKGGRSGAFAPRWISVTDEIIYALDYARQVSPAGSRNLLAPDETYIKFIRREVNPSRPLMKLHSVKGFHELRAAFACDRYKELVGIPAPVFPRPEKTDSQDQETVRAARQIISRELGHERLEVTNAYVGSERR
ncbi:integrase [Pseudomonas sp. L-22-4S-12]|uniref:integrase domain-containing protein n=1 Tax=Pseudomonas sp. L-22-4S-12 TaxID=2610893 RepID=UPI0013291847|nr:integrase domain-containing protein [Pseudomonas sp. L-22-4S-12]MWV17051.1 integrase [Pseudomonas sp. L-22-4S-12]